MSPFQEMKADRDKLLKIVELVAVESNKKYRGKNEN